MSLECNYQRPLWRMLREWIWMPTQRFKTIPPAVQRCTRHRGPFMNCIASLSSHIFITQRSSDEAQEISVLSDLLDRTNLCGSHGIVLFQFSFNMDQKGHQLKMRVKGFVHFHTVPLNYNNNIKLHILFHAVSSDWLNCRMLAFALFKRHGWRLWHCTNLRLTEYAPK